MWDARSILYIDLTKEVNDDSLKQLDFRIDKEESEIWIKGIKYGTD